MPEVPRHVDPVREVVQAVRARDALAGQEVAGVREEQQRLLPPGTGAISLPRLGEREPLSDRCVLLATHDRVVQGPGPGADLGPFDVVFGQVSVDSAIPGVRIFSPPWSQEEVHDVKPGARVGEACFLVSERSCCGTAHVAARANGHVQQRGLK